MMAQDTTEKYSNTSNTTLTTGPAPNINSKGILLLAVWAILPSDY